MKKFYLFVVLLVCGLGYAQTKYFVKISNLSYSINAGVKNRTDSRIRIIVKFQDGTDRQLYYRDIRNNGDKEVNLDVPAIDHTSKPISIECSAFVNFRTGTDANGTKSVNVNSYCANGSFTGNYSPRMSNITFQYKIDPVLDVFQGTDNFLPTDENITIKSSSGYDQSYYKWQYTFSPNYNNTTDWKDFTKYSTASISTNAEEVIGKDAGLKHGQKIYFRLKPCGTKTYNVATYSVRLSAPKILSSAPENVSCYDLGSQDGKIRLRFNRPLYTGETFSIALSIANSTKNFDNISKLEADNSYVLSGLARGNYKLTLTGFYNGSNTYSKYTELGGTPYPFTIGAPSPLDFTVKGNDILCYGVNNGSIIITPSGGTRNITGYDYYSIKTDPNDVSEDVWVPFPNNAPYTIKGLAVGSYYIKVKDMKDCVARTQKMVNGVIELGNEKVIEQKIIQPSKALEVTYTFKKNPTFYGAKNGIIVAAVSGGTIKADNSYDFIWKNSNGDELPATGVYNSTDKTYNITLENVPEDKYKLTVTDKNYGAASNKAGCSVIESLNSLKQPEKIVIKLEITQPISCNSKSLPLLAIGNKAGDGILTATVEGGVPFEAKDNNGLLYNFFWSKYNEDTKKWEKLPEYKTDVAEGLYEGSYALNVEDANGIVQGIYDTVELKTAVPTTQDIIEPKVIDLAFDSINVSCFEGSNGSVQVNVTGGTLIVKDGVKDDYKYKWYFNGKEIAKTQKISNLIKGTYTVEVTDSKECYATKDIKIGGPDFPVAINYSIIKTPTFSGASDGRLVAQISGGTKFVPGPNQGLYNFEWKNLAGDVQNATATVVNGIYTITLDNVPAGSYFLTIKDANYNETTGQIVNCSVVESEMKLTEPDPLKVVFEIVQTISCNAKNGYGDETDTDPQDNQRDESQDGILKAYVTGGTALELDQNNGLPYYFSWKKQKDDGTWEDLAVQGYTISNLSYGNYALNVKDRNDVILGTYTNGNWIAKDSIQLMDQPPVLSVRIDKGDVFCYDGNDGWATAIAEGGSGGYTYKWSNEVDIDQNTILKKGNYWVIATDKKGCSARAEVFIDGPAAPLSIKYTEVLNPSFYKATNGKIVVEVTGGTIAADDTYWFEWKNSEGVLQTSFTTTFSNGIYTISLNGLPEEIYSLTVRDANYNDATYKTSCTVANSVTELDDPDPLEVTFEVIRTISCNVSNEFGNETDANPQDNQRDESQDGILKAHVTGGIQLPVGKNNGLSYFYTWKKKQANNNWVLWNNTGDTAEYLSEGTYALNIEDANGIKLGTYVNNVLVKEVDVEKYIPQPDPLKLTFTKFDVGCTTGDDGWAEAHVTGGTAPYTYEWTNGETTPKIENITTNNYFVKVTDAKGCTVQGSIFVGDPNGILTTEIVKNPICYQGNDGSIELNVTGGNLPYSYSWNTGAVTKDLNNLSAGNYEVIITCPDCCVYKKRFVLKDPEAVIVNVGPDRTLCLDQSLDVDATNKDPQSKYSWTSTNGFTSNEAKINVSKAGTYHVKVTTALGCIGEDEIVIKTSQMAISAEFLLSSQAYLDEEVILVNTSNPFGESTDWVIPNGVKVVEQKEKYITLKFDVTGVYSVGLKQTQGECYAVFTKNIMVEKRGTLPNTEMTSQFITDFIVTPNPNNGNFKAIVNLENNSAINLRLFSSSGQNTMIQKQESGKKKYEVDFNTSLQSGVYIVVLETGQQTLVKKIIIN